LTHMCKLRSTVLGSFAKAASTMALIYLNLSGGIGGLTVCTGN
jgi:hypothetical protein